MSTTITTRRPARGRGRTRLTSSESPPEAPGEARPAPFEDDLEPWGDRLDEEEFAFRQFSLPARSTPYPPGVKVPPNLRRNIAWLVTKWPEGLSQVRLAELYGKEFGLSINTTRDCGCSLGTLIKHLHGDVLELKAGQSPSDVAIFPRGYKTDADVFEDGSTPSLLSVPVVPPPRSVHLAPIPPPRRVTTAQVGHQSISMTSLAPVQLETGEVIRSDPNTDRLALPGYVHPGIRVLPPPANLNLRKLLRNCILITVDLYERLAVSFDEFLLLYLRRFKHLLPHEQYGHRYFETFVRDWQDVAFHTVEVDGQMMLDTFGARHLPGPKRFAKPTALEEAYNQLEVALKNEFGCLYVSPAEDESVDADSIWGYFSVATG